MIKIVKSEDLYKIEKEIEDIDKKYIITAATLTSSVVPDFKKGANRGDYVVVEYACLIVYKEVVYKE
jgi:hypothetical protein